MSMMILESSCLVPNDLFNISTNQEYNLWFCISMCTPWDKDWILSKHEIRDGFYPSYRTKNEGIICEKFPLAAYFFDIQLSRSWRRLKTVPYSFVNQSRAQAWSFRKNKMVDAKTKLWLKTCKTIKLVHNVVNTTFLFHSKSNLRHWPSILYNITMWHRQDYRSFIFERISE